MLPARRGWDARLAPVVGAQAPALVVTVSPVSPRPCGQWLATVDQLQMVGVAANRASTRPAEALARTNPASTSVSNSARSFSLTGARYSRRSRTTARANPRLHDFTQTEGIPMGMRVAYYGRGWVRTGFGHPDEVPGPGPGTLSGARTSRTNAELGDYCSPNPESEAGHPSPSASWSSTAGTRNVNGTFQSMSTPTSMTSSGSTRVTGGPGDRWRSAEAHRRWPT